MELLSKFKNHYFFYLVLALLAFIPLYPKFPLSEVQGTYVAVRLEDFFIAAVLIIFGLLNIDKAKKVLHDPLYLSFLLFWIIGLISLISALLLTNTVQPHLGLLHWVRRIEYMSFFFLAVWTIKSAKQVQLLLKVFFAVVILICIYGLGQKYFNFPVISTTNREFSKGQILYLTPGARINSTFAGHYDLAAFTSIVIVILGSLFFYYRKISAKTAVIIAGGLSFLVLGLTAARVSFLATVMGLALGFWFNKMKWLIVALVLVSTVAVVAIPDLRHRVVATVTVNLLGGGGPKYNPDELNVAVGEKLTPEVRQEILNQATMSGAQNIATVSSDIAPGEPINQLELAISRSFGIRSQVSWPRAIHAFEKNPILGTGYSSLTIASDNDYLRSLGEVGILGTLAFGLIFYILFREMLRFIKREPKNFERAYVIGVLCSIFVMLVTATFIDIFESSKIATLFWFLVGTAWVMIRKYEDN